MNVPTQRYVTLGLAICAAAIWLMVVDVMAQTPPASPGRGADTQGGIQTPRRSTGVPDFSGVWVPTRPWGAPTGGFARFDPQTGRLTLPSRTNNPVDFERDAGVALRVFPRERRPWYSPRHWERVQFSDVHGHSAQAPDPEFQCMPAGVPRIGLPEEIAQTDRHMIFLYPLRSRRVYLDGRPHPPQDQWVGTWLGHSVGRWEGDTLVISTVDFNGLEWLGWPGWITSPDKRVIERMRRVGNTLTWEAEVTDPILLQPWRTGPQTRQLNPDPRAELEEALPCVERDLQHMVTRERG
ncbi:MAG: hypothetical protein ACRD3C_01895 [Vicinamibacterales bacterium]